MTDTPEDESPLARHARLGNPPPPRRNPNVEAVARGLNADFARLGVKPTVKATPMPDTPDPADDRGDELAAALAAVSAACKRLHASLALPDNVVLLPLPTYGDRLAELEARLGQVEGRLPQLVTPGSRGWTVRDKLLNGVNFETLASWVDAAKRRIHELEQRCSILQARLDRVEAGKPPAQRLDSEGRP